MPIADWTVPFTLVSTPYTNYPTPGGVSVNPLPINTVVTFPSGTGYYFLRSDGCSLSNTVRQTKDYVPQADGAILHRRFTGGMEMNLAIQLWQNTTDIACDELLQEMLDTLMGYLYGLINAGDNQGRIRWAPVGGTSTNPSSNGIRMLDDIRLLSYPTSSQERGGPVEVSVIVDCARPYAEDETQLNPTVPTDPIINYGNRPTFPVWQIYSPLTNLQFTLTNTTNGDSFTFDDTLPGCPNVGIGNYIEIDTFRNTVYKNGSGANMKPGIDMTNSDFFTIPPGTHTITCPGVSASSKCLINAAWA